MGLNVSVVCGQRLNAIVRQALLANPLQRLALQAFVERNAAGNHVAPRLCGIASVGKEKYVFALAVANLH